MKISNILLSVAVAFTMLSWINANYDPSKFDNKSACHVESKEINIKKG